MPLLRRQAFQKEKTPDGLKPDDEVFYCRVTGEVFTDYEKFFERIILCNSLVWSCSITGRSGLTYQEALDSEKKAQKTISDFPTFLQKPILYLASLTHRTRLSDVNDDVFVFVKDRYFTGEHVEVTIENDRKMCRIVKIDLKDQDEAKNGGEQQDDSDCMIVDEQDSDDEPLSKLVGEKSPSQEISQFGPASDKYQYVVQELKKPQIYIVDSHQVSRKKGVFTREKCKLFLKNHLDCDSVGVFKIKERYVKKFGLRDVTWSTYSEGPLPMFGVSRTKKLSGNKAGASTSEMSKEEIALKKAKKEAKLKKKRDKMMKQQSKEREKEERRIKRLERRKERRAELKAEKEQQERERLEQARKPETLEEKLSKMSKEELAAYREQIKEEKRKKMEEERQKKKEERQKEKEQRDLEKKRQMEIMKEWSKPRDDLECDDLKDLPRAHPIKSRVPDSVFGNAVMVLEYINCCMSVLFNVEKQFPKGISIDDLGRALQDTDTNGLYSDLVSFLLTSIFQLQEEEEEFGADEVDPREAEDVPENFGGSGSHVSYKDLIRRATRAAQVSQLNFGTKLNELQLDCFTLTEVLRMHIQASGAESNESNLRFRYQRRGGYIPQDDAGLAFKHQEAAIMKALSEKSVFDLSPGDKIKVLEVLAHQLLSFSAMRDSVDECIEKLRKKRLEVRVHLQTELRRDREESAFWYKKRQEEKLREKEQKKKELEERLRAAENGQGVAPEVEDDAAAATAPAAEAEKKKPAAEPPRPIRCSKRGGRVLDEAPPPPEEMDWEKVTPEERIQIREWAEHKEAELTDTILQLQACTAIYPLGRDRTYRRYWVFRSLPGILVEDQDDLVPDDLTPVPQKFASEYKVPVKEEAAVNGKTVSDEKNISTSSDKENDSLHEDTAEGTSPSKTVKTEALVNGDVHEETAISQDKIPEESKELSPFVSVYEQISTRGQVRWSYYCTTEELDGLIDNLNRRGFREGPLKQALIEQKKSLLESLKKCPTELLSVPEQDAEGRNVRFMALKSRNKKVQGQVSSAQASQYIELNLRESLLDLEERIYAGGLGALKVENRLKWREALEQGLFDPQMTTIDLGETVLDVEEYRTTSEEDSLDASHIVVKDLALAMLQISQMPENKFLKPPLGEAEVIRKEKQVLALELAFKGLTPSKIKAKVWDRRKKAADDSDDDDESTSTPSETTTKTTRERWEESLLNCSSLSQIFVHMSVLEHSVLWEHSALQAKCKLCRRKGDDEKMLLCDGCDKGFHMYCLKPPLKKIPQGDWYCPLCRPQDIARTPKRNYKRRQPIKQIEEEEEESEEEEEVEDSEDTEVSGAEDEVEDGDEDTTLEEEQDQSALESTEEEEEEDEESQEESDEETEEEAEPEPAKIRFGRFQSAKKGKKPIQTSPSESGKSSRSNTPTFLAGGSKKDRKRPSTPRGRGSLEKAVQLKAVAANKEKAEKNKQRHSIETEQPSRKRRKMNETQEEEPAQTSRGKPGRKGARQSLEPKASKKEGSETQRGRKRAAVQEEVDDEGFPAKKLTTKSRGNDPSSLQLKECEKLVHELIKQPESWPFRQPVSKKLAPDYYDFISEPMDFATITKNMCNFAYLEAENLLSDMLLIFQNCFHYNRETAEVYVAGQKLHRFFMKRMRELKLDSLLPKKGANSPSNGGAKKRTSRGK